MSVSVSTNSFKENQRSYLDLAAAGTQVILRRTSRGQKQSFAIVPIDEADDDYDSYFTPEVLSRLDRSLQEAERGEVVICSTDEELTHLLESL
ncbi:MAG: hypothetical protein LBQ31_09995 [Bacteroidales bacterium]|jgi:hypothetical protein|nr:hypothetical protein [Bacteroidales bacterium]